MVRRFIVFFFFLIAGSAAIGAMLALAFSGTEAGRGPRIVVIVLAVVLGGPWLLFRGLRRTWLPVGELMDATNRLGSGESDVRVRSTNRGPMRMVAQSFNKMAERLDAEEDRRRRLLADLGHELRTPLSVMRGEIEALLDGVRPADTEHLEALLDDVEVMERLLNDLRTLTMAEAGQLELHLEETDLVELVEDVLAGLKGRAATQTVEMEVVAPEDVRAEVDPVRIREVVINLAVNALRHMPEGGTLTATVRPNPPTFEVADTGPGIPADQLDAIFDRFVKAADSQGSGLGLTIVKDLVEAHGGTVRASNEQGAVFTVELPGIRDQ